MMTPGAAGALLATEIAAKCLHKDRARQIVDDWVTANELNPEPADAIEELSACIHVLAVQYFASAAEMLRDTGVNVEQVMRHQTLEARRAIFDREND